MNLTDGLEAGDLEDVADARDCACEGSFAVGGEGDGRDDFGELGSEGTVFIGDGP